MVLLWLASVHRTGMQLGYPQNAQAPISQQCVLNVEVMCTSIDQGVVTCIPTCTDTRDRDQNLIRLIIGP